MIFWNLSRSGGDYVFNLGRLLWKKKIFALMLFAIVAGLSRLVVPDPERGPTPLGNHMRANQGTEAPNEQAFRSQSERVQSMPRRQGHQRLRIEHTPSIKELAATAKFQKEYRQRIRYQEVDHLIDLKDLPPDAAMSELLPMVIDSDPDIRLAAVESLGEMNHPARSSMLAIALDDSVPQKRIAALGALATRGDATAWVYIDPYLEDTDTEVRLAAIEALAVLESDQAIHSLAGLLFDKEKLVRHNTVSAIGEIGGVFAVSYLLQARYDTDATIRANVASILYELGVDPEH